MKYRNEAKDYAFGTARRMGRAATTLAVDHALDEAGIAANLVA